MISDSYDLKDVDGIVFEADCAMIEEGALNISMSTSPYIAHCCCVAHLGAWAGFILFANPLF